MIIIFSTAACSISTHAAYMQFYSSEHRKVFLTTRTSFLVSYILVLVLVATEILF